MKRICSFCLDILEDGPEPASHGLCPMCTVAIYGAVGLEVLWDLWDEEARASEQQNEAPG